MGNERGNVWIAVAGIVIKDGKWLVVKKKYGGLKGKWSLPAGFVNERETIDEAAIREVAEETGILTKVIDIVGVRTGVINEVISDNMIIFLLEEVGGKLSIQLNEIEEAAFMSLDELEKDKDTSMLVHLYLKKLKKKSFHSIKPDPGEIFQYTSYKVYY